LVASISGSRKIHPGSPSSGGGPLVPPGAHTIKLFHRIDDQNKQFKFVHMGPLKASNICAYGLGCLNPSEKAPWGHKQLLLNRL